MESVRGAVEERNGKLIVVVTAAVFDAVRL
jgi:hypothetical protein